MQHTDADEIVGMARRFGLTAYRSNVVHIEFPTGWRFFASAANARMALKAWARMKEEERSA